ncbi:MAG: TIGR02450 family Trp-rich protein [Thiomicrorhabdus sp.]|jgi:tryptophan-rich hypothetical protein|nr:TIGR02450 family Trp-rich protein [Thiomicrorhabdus sp.]
MNIFNPKKLLNSKWTAVTPVNKARHFIITKLQYDIDGQVVLCLLEAVIDKQEVELPPASFKESSIWMQGWC